jgi:hypothetical protein
MKRAEEDLKSTYAAPRVLPLTLAEARAKLQADPSPGDASAQEMLKRINELLMEEEMAQSDTCRLDVSPSGRE